MEMTPCVYMKANKPNGSRYIGVTSKLFKRVLEYKTNLVKGLQKTTMCMRWCGMSDTKRCNRQ